MDNYQYTATVNGGEYELDNLQEEAFDGIEVVDGVFHILYKGTKYHAHVLAVDLLAKVFKLRVDGHIFEVQLANEFDRLAKDMGLSAEVQQKGGDILAPMPGLILDILVEEGQTIKEGDPLLILEAMKMENVLKSTGEGVVKEILVTKGQTIDKHETLIAIDSE